MKNKLRYMAAVIVLLFAVTLTGCVRMDVSITVKKNGKVDFSFLYAVVNAGIVDMSEEELDPDQWTEKGYTVTKYNEDGYIGMLVTAEDMDPSKLSEKNGGLGDFSEGEVLKREGSTFILDMDVWSSDGMDEILPYLSMLENYGGYMRLTLTTPVKAKNANATAISDDGRTLTWDLTKMNGDKLHAEYSLGTALWLIISVAVVVLGLIVYVVLFFWSRRRAAVYRNADPEFMGNSAEKAVFVGNSSEEIFDIVDENGLPTGDTVSRTEAHAQGIRHRTAHIWVVRKVDGKCEMLLQKRAEGKDSFPGCYDTSSSGHIHAGDEPADSARRELAEELGIQAAPDDLIYAGSFRISYEKEFYGRMFRDNEIASVYMFTRPVELSELHLQKEEVSEAVWFDLDYIESQLNPRNSLFCIPEGGFQIAAKWCRENLL